MPNLTPHAFFNLSAYRHAVLFDNCSYVWQALEKLDEFFATWKEYKIAVKIPEGAYLENVEQISIGKGTIIEPGAFIRGPCIIGENCTLRHGVYIRGHLVTGNSCVLGHTTEIKSSIFLDDAHAAHFAYIGNSIIGNKVNLGAGTKCANFKLDGQAIKVQVDGSFLNTGLRKLGAIIGDKTQLGCNTVTNPGTLLGQNVLGYPTLNLSGSIPSNSILKSTEKVIVLPQR